MPNKQCQGTEGKITRYKRINNPANMFHDINIQSEISQRTHLQTGEKHAGRVMCSISWWIHNTTVRNYLFIFYVILQTFTLHI